MNMNIKRFAPALALAGLCTILSAGWTTPAMGDEMPQQDVCQDDVVAFVACVADSLIGKTSTMDQLNAIKGCLATLKQNRGLEDEPTPGDP